MTTVLLTHRPTRDPKDEQPHRTELKTVSEALAHSYKLSLSRGFQVGTEIRKDGDVKYDQSALSMASTRMSTLINDDGISVDEAAKQVAKEDGHVD